MTNVVKNRIMRILAVIAIVCVGIVTVFSIRPANAEQNIAGENEFAVQQEAGIYIGDKLSGISFKTDVDRTFYQGLADEEVEFYTLVTAEHFLVDGDITSLTVESASEMEAVHLKSPIDIQFDDEGQTTWTYDVAITYEDAGLSDARLKQAYQTKLVARSYLKKSDGAIIYADSDFVGISIEEVAQKELAKALKEQAVLSQENVEKFMQYLPEKDVNAYFDKTGEIEFIDQFLDGAEVYVVNSEKDNFDLISSIQNGKLISNTITLSSVGNKTEYVVSNGEKAFKTNATQVTKIISTAEEFREIFWTPVYHLSVTHSITYNGQTLTETFNDIDNPEMVYRTAGRDYINLSDEFVEMLANGATRNVDSQTVTAEDVDGYYVLSNNIYELGTNGNTYCYNFHPGIVTKNNAALAPSTTKGTDAYDNAGYKFAGNNAYYLAQNFTGTFDGLGYFIDGYVSNTQGGLFGTLNNATVKNLALTNVECGTGSTSTGVLAYQTAGKETLVENIYIQVNSIPNTNKWGALYYNNKGIPSTARNVVIQMPEKVWDIEVTFGSGIIGSSTSSSANVFTTENVVAITKTDLVCGYGLYKGVYQRVWVAENDANLIAEGGKYANFSQKKIQYGVFRYDDMANAVASNAFANFTADCWKINKDGSIGWKSIPETLEGVHVYSAEEKIMPDTLTQQIEEEIISMKDVYGNELLIDGVLTIEAGNTVTDMPIDVITVSGSKYTVVFNVYSKFIYTAEQFAEIFLSPQYTYFETTHRIDTDGDYTTVEYTETVNSRDNPELVYCYMTEGRENYCLTNYNSSLSLSETAKALIQAGGTRLVDSNQKVVATPIEGSYALVNDIDGLRSTSMTSPANGRTGRTWAAPYSGTLATPATLKGVAYNTDSMGYGFSMASNYKYEQTFNGTFDGLGHTISNVEILDRAPIFGTIGKATIKNVAFTGVTLSGQYNATLAYAVSSAETVIDNVYIEVTKMDSTLRQGGVVFATHSSAKGWKLTNSVIVTPETEYASAYTSGPLGCTNASTGNIPTLENTIFITTSPWIMRYSTNRAFIGEGENDLVGVTNSVVLKGATRFDNLIELGLANRDLSKFSADCWDISTGIPVWRALADTITTDWRDEVNNTVEIRADGEKVEEITFGNADADSKTFELYSSLTTIDFNVEIDDQRVATYANGVVSKVGVGATKLTYTYSIFGKEYSGEVLVSVTQGQFIKGEGRPDSTIGADGDTYLDNTTNDIYAKENGNWVLVGNLDGDVAIRLDGGLVQDTEIYTTDAFMGNTYKNSVKIEIFKNGQLVEGTIAILNNEDYISIDNGVITATKEGEVDIRIIYNHNGIDIVEQFTLSIVKPVANYNELIENFSALDGELPLNEIFGKEVTLIGAKNLNDTANVLTVENNKVLGLKTSRLGKTTAKLELESTESRMIIDLEGYTMIIDEAKDFTAFNLVSNSIDGYFIVVNDIEYDATVPVNRHPGRDTTGGFIGVFDGNGHKITVGVANDGIFGRVGVGGVIKNAGFVNTVFTIGADNQTSFVLARVVSGSAKGYATVTNCYFEQNDFRSTAKGNRTAFISVGRGSATIDNVLFNVNMPENFESAPYGGGVLWAYDSSWTSGTTQPTTGLICLTNVYVVGDFKYMGRIWATDHYRSYYAENEGIENDGRESFTYLGVYRYDTFEDLGDNNTCKWQYVDGKVVFVDEVDFFVPQASYNLQGRAQEYANTYKFQLPNAGIDIAFKGENLELKLQNSGNVQAKVRIYIDDQVSDVLFLDALTTYTKTGLGDGEHVVRIVNAYEESTGWILRGVKVDEFAPISKNNLRIQILGDSITTGYGATKESGSLSHNITNSDSTFSYSYLLPLALGADYSVVAKQGITVAKPTTVNMLDLYDHMSLTNSNVPEEEFDVVIVNLGTNDASCGDETGFDSDEYRANFAEYYKQLLTKIRERNPNAKIVCVFNMMLRVNVQIIEDGIIEAVEEMNDANIYTKVDFTPAVNGHPNKYEHIAYAQILADYITSILED